MKLVTFNETNYAQWLSILHEELDSHPTININTNIWFHEQLEKFRRTGPDISQLKYKHNTTV
jgi:hypothetical protein